MFSNVAAPLAWGRRFCCLTLPRGFRVSGSGSPGGTAQGAPGFLMGVNRGISSNLKELESK